VKKQILKLAGLIVLFVLPVTMMAQERGIRQGQGDRAERQKQRMEELKKTLNLKKDQVAKFEKVNTDFDKKQQKVMTAMREGGDRTGMREKMTKMTTEREAAIKKLLNKDQLKKYEAYLKKLAAERQQRGNRGGSGRR